MNKSMRLVCTVCLLFLTWMPLNAQTNVNLLLNPGFEAPFSTMDGTPPRQVAQGWTAWHNAAPPDSPGFVNVQPEYVPAAPDMSRINEGSNAQELSAFYATFDGGVYQRVTGLSAGVALTFQVNAYVWSTTYDDRDVSELDGDVFVQVGIDPNGGTDPQSTDIVWSAAGVENYDAYTGYSVDADAGGSAVTVFVRASIGEPVRNTEVYLDSASLTASGGQPVDTEVPTDTSVPPSATSMPPTDTEVPPSETSVPPTDTSVPPTNTTEPPTPTQAAAITDTPDLALTATSVSADATETAVNAAATATEPPTATTDTGVEMTATAIVEAATATAQAEISPTPQATESIGPISDTFPSTITHTVQYGETVSILAARYGSTIEAIKEANGLDDNYLIRVGQGLVIPVRLPAPETATPTATPLVVVVTSTPSGTTSQPPSTSGGTYVVQPGDTLSAIANRYNTTVYTLAQLNGIVNVNQIRWGQVLRLPTEGSPGGSSPSPTPTPERQTYVVRPGDSLYRISLLYGVSIARLVEANNLTNPNFIYTGQILVIP